MLGLLGHARGGTADVESFVAFGSSGRVPHGGLGAGLPDGVGGGLGGDDADGLTDLDQLAAGQVAALAAAADAPSGLAGEAILAGAADLELLDARFLVGVGQLVGELFVLRSRACRP